MQFDLFDSVRLLADHEEFGLDAGAVGVVVHRFDDPPAYEVEFCDLDGETVAGFAVPAEELALEAKGPADVYATTSLR